MINGKNDTTFRRSSAEMIAFAIFLFLIIFLATRIGTFIHEFFGHALAATIVGGQVTSISIDLFATGYCRYVLPHSGPLEYAFVGLAGIAANFVSGFAAFYMVMKWRLPWEWKIMLCLFAMISVCSQLVYLVTGAYYDYGDPSVFQQLLGSTKWCIWFFALFSLASCTYIFAQSYLKLQNQWAPSITQKDRLITLFATLAIASLLYTVCYWVEGGTTGFLGGIAASEQTITRIAQTATESDALSEAEKTILFRSIKEKLKPFPIIGPTLLIVFLSGLKAFWNTKNDPAVWPPRDFKIAYLQWGLFLSLIAGCLIVFYYR